MQFPCQTEKYFFPCFIDRNGPCQIGSVAICYKVLHFALHFATRRKSMVDKELRKTRPAGFSLSPYPVRLYNQPALSLLARYLYRSSEVSSLIYNLYISLL